MDAYGYNALAGFFGSSSRKERRNEELQYMQAISTMQDKQQAQEDAQRQAFQQSIDQSYSIANNLLTGQHARQQDKEKIRQMSDDYLTPINDMLRQYGSYEKAKQFGIDRLISEYQYKLNNNDFVYQVSQNKGNLAKIIQAQNSNKGHLISMRDKDNYAKFMNGETDAITYRGQLDGEIDTEFLKDMTVEEKVGLEHYLLANQATLISDFEYHIGDHPNKNEIMKSVYQDPTLMMPYLEERLAGTQVADYGEKEIKTTLGTELVKGLDMAPKATGAQLRQYSYGDIFKASGADQYYDMLVGYDENSRPIVKNSIVAQTSGEIFTNPDMQEKVLRQVFGDRIQFDEGDFIIENFGDGAGLFNFQGSMITEDELGPLSMEKNLDDMLIKGIFVGQKAIGKDKFGRTIEILMTEGESDLDPTNRASTINEKLAALDDVQFQPAYIIQMEEDDMFQDDVYYKELSMDYVNIAGLDKDEKINETLSSTRTNIANFAKDKKRKEKQVALKKKAQNQLSTIYAEGNEGGVDLIAQTYSTPIAISMLNAGIDNKMLPIVMTELLEGAGQQAKMNNTANTHEIMNSAIANLSRIKETDPELHQILTSGNLELYYRYKEKTATKEEVNNLKSRSRLWTKYFNY